ncbi:MAG: hypothetical protein JSV02_05245 [Dehalococcoidia bacterium]|nr:MAG: hypothetical protein JSV02_05245 [Dehalococcoidia bacterium]
MTLSRGDKIIENLTGTGQVRRKGEIIAQACYCLYVEIEEITARSFGQNETHFSRKNVNGEITLLDGAMLSGDNPATPSGSFTLVLKDGREVDFRVESCTVEYSPTRQVCRIHGSGNKL